MFFTAYFNDGYSNTYNADDVKAAYKVAAKESVGRYITLVKDYNTDTTLYSLAAGGFIDPVDIIRAAAAEISADDLLKIVTDHLVRRRLSLDQDGQLLQAVYDGEKINIRHDPSDELFKRFNFSISIEEVQELNHEWADNSCTRCGLGLFDVEDPAGTCEV